MNRKVWVVVLVVWSAIQTASGLGVRSIEQLPTGIGLYPSWSPDGSKIAYCSVNTIPYGYASNVSIIDVDAKKIKTVTTFGKHGIWDCISKLGWSPDGKMIAFSSERAGNMSIYIINIDDSTVVQLTTDEEKDASPTWSPDGEKIAFESLRSGNYDIFVMDKDGSNITQLTVSKKDDDSPSWSPDGSKIAFSSCRTGKCDIYTMNVDGRNKKRLTSGLGSDFFPVWSPDGSKIAFLSYTFGFKIGVFPILYESDIWVIDSDGTNLTRLTYGSKALMGGISWAPDGNRIAFLSGEYDTIFIANLGPEKTQAPKTDIWEIADEFFWFFVGYIILVSIAGGLAKLTHRNLLSSILVYCIIATIFLLFSVNEHFLLLITLAVLFGLFVTAYTAKKKNSAIWGIAVGLPLFYLCYILFIALYINYLLFYILT